MFEITQKVILNDVFLEATIEITHTSRRIMKRTIICVQTNVLFDYIHILGCPSAKT